MINSISFSARSHLLVDKRHSVPFSSPEAVRKRKAIYQADIPNLRSVRYPRVLFFGMCLTPSGVEPGLFLSDFVYVSVPGFGKGGVFVPAAEDRTRPGGRGQAAGSLAPPDGHGLQRAAAVGLKDHSAVFPPQEKPEEESQEKGRGSYF